MELGRDPKHLGAEFGVTSVLHTWTRELLFHPHVHCVVTGGGEARPLSSMDILSTPTSTASSPEEGCPSTDPDGSARARASSFPSRALGALFRGKFLARLVRLHDAGKLRLDGPAASFADPRRFARLRDRLYRMRWHVDAKPPFGGPDEVFRYLGRYTHRVGLSNRRLVSFDDRGITFRTRGASTVTVSPDEFLGRFLLHVLPKGFVKIRHHRLLAPCNVSTTLAAARRLLGAEPPPSDAARPVLDFCELLLALTGIDLSRCPRCGW